MYGQVHLVHPLLQPLVRHLLVLLYSRQSWIGAIISVDEWLDLYMHFFVCHGCVHDVKRQAVARGSMAYSVSDTQNTSQLITIGTIVTATTVVYLK